MGRSPVLKKHLSILGYVLLLLVISRVLLYAAGYLGGNLFNQYTMKPDYETVTQAYGQTHDRLKLPVELQESRPVKLADLFKFDTYFYMRIVETGYDRYSMDEPHPPANWVFFPLYPLTVAAAAKLLPFWETHTVGVLLSNLYLWLALYVLYLIGLERGLSKKRTRTVLFLLLLYPSSLYFSIMYTESLFLLLSAASIYLAMTRRHGAALLVAGLSTVTRVPGVANLLYVGGSLLLSKGWRLSWRDWRYFALGAVSLLPLTAYFTFLYVRTGDFFAAIHEQSNWAREEAFPFQAYFHYLTDPYFVLEGGWDNGVISFTLSTFVLAAFAAAFLSQVRSFRERPERLLFFLYGALLITIPFSSSPTYLTSVVRYMMVSIPLFFYLEELGERHDLVRKFSVGFLALFQVFITVCFFNDYFFVV